MNDALGMFETVGLTPALVALDAMEKSARVVVHQAEINDRLGVIIKFVGSPADVQAAIAAGSRVAESMGVQAATDIILSPDPRAWQVISSQKEYNPLTQQDVVHFPDFTQMGEHLRRESKVNKQSAFALGFIETQGFTAVFEAIDSACKAANVEVVGKEKLGGGYVTVIVKGDVAAVKAAIDAGKLKVEGLGQLIAAHVIAHPSPSVLGLLPPAIEA